jgi:hypothetical protein
MEKSAESIDLSNFGEAKGAVVRIVTLRQTGESDNYHQGTQTP